MQIAILYNQDHDHLEEDPGREARKDVARVAFALANALTEGELMAEPFPVEGSSFAFIEALKHKNPDLVINLCESIGADSRGEMVVPYLLELAGIPYTGSTGIALGLSLHKNKAKELLKARGVPTPEFRLVERPEDLVLVDLPFPLIVKPSREDASVGIDFESVVTDRAGLGRAALRILKAFHQPALVEAFVPGREIYVSLLGNRPWRALPLTEIQFGPSFEDRPKIVSYSAKWDLGSAECLDSPSVPCVLDGRTEAKVLEASIGAFEALDCRDYGRVDLRLNDLGEPFVIDVNPNCDLHPDAGFAKAAAAAGIDYAALAVRLVEIAMERTHGNSPNRKLGPPAALRAFGPSRNVLAARGGLRARAHRHRARAE